MVKMALPRTKAATDAIVAARRPREKRVFIVEDGEGGGEGVPGRRRREEREFRSGFPQVNEITWVMVEDG